MEATHITSNPRSGKIGTINEEDDDNDNDDDDENCRLLVSYLLHIQNPV